MSSLKRFDHVGITVADLDGAIAFFENLGLELMGRTVVAGEFIDTVCGMRGAQSDIAMMKLPGDAGTTVELARFIHPDAVTPQVAPENAVGIRNVAFEVTGLRDLVTELEKRGHGLVGGIGEYEDAWQMAHVRGPEGIIVALAERLM